MSNVPDHGAEAQVSSSPSRNKWRRWLVALLIIVLIIEAIWLVGVNFMLSRPSTQSMVSEIRPDRVQMTWEKAWSWYPGQVVVTGAKVSGQSPRFQWQADVSRVEGNVAFLPLLERRVVIRGVRIPDGEYRQRSRLKPDGSNEAVSQWFPPIRNYELTPIGERPKPKKAPWTIVFEDAELAGSYTTWIHRFHASLDLNARVNVEVRTQGGPLELHAEELNARVQRLWADNDQTIFDNGSVSGSLSLGPYRYREHRGGRALRFLSSDTHLEFNSDDLSFVELFLLNFPSLQVEGKGSAKGRLKIDSGRVVDGTSLHIDADDLNVSQPPFRVAGKGVVTIEAGGDPENPSGLSMRYEDLDLYIRDDDTPMITGDELVLHIRDNGDLVPRKLQDPPPPLDFAAKIQVSNSRISDITHLNRLLPLDSPVLFSGGQADFSADLDLSPTHIKGSYQVGGEQLMALIDQQLVGLDMKFVGVVTGSEPLKWRFGLTGSVLELTNAKVIGAESSFEEDNWSASAHVTDGTLSMLGEPDLSVSTDLQVSDSRPLSALFINNGGPKWIGRQLNVSGLKGDAQFRLANRDLYLPTARLAADDLEFAIKGVVAKPQIHGMAYFRYKRLDAGLKFENGKRDFVLIGPIKKFDEYSVTMPVPDQAENLR